MPFFSVSPLAVTRSDQYTYKFAGSLAVGSVVKLPMAGRVVPGVVLGPAKQFPGAKSLTPSGFRLPEPQVSLARWLSDEYAAPLGLCLKLFLPNAALSRQPETVSVPQVVPQTGTHSLEVLSGPDRFEHYRSAVVSARASKRSALLLVPERAVTPRYERRLLDQFPEALTYHSGLTLKQRAEFWWQVFSGRAEVVIGTRSALFLPWQNLGTIILDEEDDLSYKEEHTPTYHARSVAARLSQHGSRLIYGSITPSLEVCQAAAIRRIPVAGQPVVPKRLQMVDPSRHRSGGLLSYELETALGGMRAGQVALLYAPDRLQAELVSETSRTLSVQVTRFNPERIKPEEIDRFWQGVATGRRQVVIGGQNLARDWGVRAELVGCVGIDRLLQLQDFRAAEKSHNLLIKLADRIAPEGVMIIQSSELEHPALTGLRDHHAFVASELAERRQLRLPPFVRVCRLRFAGTSAAKAAERVTEKLRGVGIEADVVPGPTSASWHVMVKADPKQLLPHLDRSWHLDVDPVTL